MTDKDKTYHDINIRHFKLVSGDEVISYVTDVKNEKESLLTLERPLQIHRMGMGSFFFSKWHPFSKKDECVVNPSQIVSHSECADAVKERYIQICLDISKESNMQFLENIDIEKELEKRVEDLKEEINLLPKNGKGPTYH